jgi:hypothetical protein
MVWFANASCSPTAMCGSRLGVRTGNDEFSMLLRASAAA